jgi:transposase InsO family protein
MFGDIGYTLRYNTQVGKEGIMPWKEVSVMSLRKEFVFLATNDNGCNFSHLCSRFGISRKTGYKWIKRFLDYGEDGLVDRSRCPHNSPSKTPQQMERAVLTVRQQHPAWGGRKIKRRLENMGYQAVPVPSTITAILQRGNCITQEESGKHKTFLRFQRSAPNELWQMDFKGSLPCPEGRCHPFTLLDDYSRYAIALKACQDETTQTVKECLIRVFRQYGLPCQMLMDNGSPWGSDKEHIYTPLTVWLIRLGILIAHSRPYHPQTLGKDERFHKTLKAELLGQSIPWRREESQRRFDQWRMVYNCKRPHQALNMQVPASLYQVSQRPFTQKLEEIQYAPEDIVRKVQAGGIISFNGDEYRIPKAFRGERIALRPRPQEDEVMDVFYYKQNIAHINLKKHNHRVL